MQQACNGMQGMHEMRVTLVSAISKNPVDIALACLHVEATCITREHSKISELCIQKTFEMTVIPICSLNKMVSFSNAASMQRACRPCMICVSPLCQPSQKILQMHACTSRQRASHGNIQKLVNYAFKYGLDGLQINKMVSFSNSTNMQCHARHGTACMSPLSHSSRKIMQTLDLNACTSRQRSSHGDIQKCVNYAFKKHSRWPSI